MAAWNYAIFPGGAMIVYFFILTLLPVAISFHENSKETVVNWRNSLARGQLPKKVRILMQRKVWSVRPVTQNAGLFGYNLYAVDKDRMGIFLSSIIDNTINLLVAFDLKGITIYF